MAEVLPSNDSTEAPGELISANQPPASTELPETTTPLQSAGNNETPADGAGANGILTPKTPHVYVVRSTARGRGRGRGRRRGRGSGSIIRATRNIQVNAITPCDGWRIKAVMEERIQMDNVFLLNALTERARLFCRSALDQMHTEMNVRRLDHSRASHIVLLCDEVLHKCLDWTNESIVLKHLSISPLRMSDMYSFLGVSVFSQCSGFSLAKSLFFLSKLDCPVPTLQLVRFISANILAFSATGRGDQGESVWNSQRDQTVHLSEFEQAPYRMSCKVFLSPGHTFATLDDDLYGTRAIENQVKTLS
ncbi:unnamed protein product [Chondrus crispus]|uniref:Uncharacterized protein n=1 Tax=Chondrus crispus TaxID=2769 RepID=R7QSR0_CHOCR|nr:unnamed protein product [Chondrus crispus]CDF41179.1 unnamed protein product [Chondrus crispus]|eukprot:XP_005711473.1 unnamed protein product [Chondrus crispus]